MRDPLGRQALFSPPPPAIGVNGNGKRSLYSSKPATSPWSVFVVDCSACGVRSRLSGIELVARHLPFWLWVPWQRYSNLMSCPACEQRTWLGVTWSP
jgi:hypothetical protein